MVLSVWCYNWTIWILQWILLVKLQIPSAGKGDNVLKLKHTQCDNNIGCYWEVPLPVEWKPEFQWSFLAPFCTSCSMQPFAPLLCLATCACINLNVYIWSLYLQWCGVMTLLLCSVYKNGVEEGPLLRQNCCMKRTFVSRLRNCLTPFSPYLNQEVVVVQIVMWNLWFVIFYNK